MNTTSTPAVNDTPTPAEFGAVDLLCTLTMKAYVRIARERSLTVDPDKASADMRAVLHAEVSNFLSEWQAALDAHLSEAWLEHMMKAQAVSYALKALSL